jgi:perosamine synthetase|tara:strand:- start:44 stop:1081 length:1038 start_codon:yes stop_codon:yes gene_type:complete
LDSSWISSKGKYVELFEREFSDATDTAYATSVCNGTVALHLALLALGVGEGDEVIVPTFTYIASVNCIEYVGATPVFVDCLEDTWQLDPEDVRKRITSKTKAIVAVHLYGHPAEMSDILSIAKENGVFVVEDCAEAFGSLYEGKHVGGFGDIATYSFFGNKTITCGEGGMVVTNNETLHDRCKSIKGQGLATHRQYWHDIIGYNYRMTNICAAIGYAQLQRKEETISRKRQIAEIYKEQFDGTSISYHKEKENVYHSYWMFSVIMQINEKERDLIRDALYEKGIETRPLFYPVHTMPIYSSKYEMHRVSEEIHRKGFNIPSYPELTNEQVLYIAESIKKLRKLEQ